MTNPIDAWISQLVGALDVDPTAIDRATLLDLARDAAHGVARPAAPITTFVVGLAAGLRGGSTAAIDDAVATAQRLISALPPHPEGGTD
ncbi:MAG: hypothetical protein QOG80_3488 [Pseudonocardiales bacterium]|jgi:hypothetical protein|nr:hypothetical protein [Pseudonocardiales bacterium]